MAITAAAEAEKRLGQHLIDAANAITPEVAKTVYAQVLERMELQRERFMTVTDGVGGDYRDQFVSWIKGEGLDGEDAKKIAHEWTAIFQSHDSLLDAPYEREHLNFPATYFYRTGEFGSGEKDEYALRLGWINVDMPAVRTRNPLEMAIRDYVVGITNDDKKVISAMTSQLRTKAQAAVKNHSLQGVANYVYNQYVKGLSGNPFVDRLIGVDLFTNEEVTGLYSGTAAGTNMARQQMEYQLKGFAQELRAPESLAGYGISGSLYSLMMTRFVNDGNWYELHNLFVADMVDNWIASRELPFYKGLSDHMWRYGVFNAIDTKLEGEAQDEFRQHCWNNVLSDEQRDEVVAELIDHFNFDPLRATGGIARAQASLRPFYDLVTEAHVLDFFKNQAVVSSGYARALPEYFAQGVTLADIAPAVITMQLIERRFNKDVTREAKRFEHLSGPRIRYIYDDSDEMGPVAKANQAALFTDRLVIYEDDYYVVDDKLRETLRTWMTMDRLIEPERMAKIKRLNEIAHDLDACDYELYRYYQSSYGVSGEIELRDIDGGGEVIAFRK